MDRLIRARSGQVLALGVVRATTFRTRLRGLLGRSCIGDADALLLAPAKQVHTFGMRFPLDVVFCDAEMNVLHVVHSLAPNRVTRFVLGARRVFELRAGGADGIEVGDRLELHSSER